MILTAHVKTSTWPDVTSGLFENPVRANGTGKWKLLCNVVCKTSIQCALCVWNEQVTVLFSLLSNYSSRFIGSCVFLYLKGMRLAGGKMPRPARLLSSVASCWSWSNCISPISKVKHTNCLSSLVAKNRPGH